ncbi:anti-sigma factor [Actinomycetospora endophytica]|uniref:Regulator of SigK n=1 Tax=Actinomycetospora endophytica TaxID=2291215 RepID=A0ABS8PEF3_9PSEU|nr:anti-sigma factor [Actinomycetospora endophytica]MCD2196649.1 anti-sigma factor [Actinomycetospora endophytica]
MTAPLPASAHGHPELAVAWVMHGLEPDEAEVFAAHLDECEGCLRIVAETEDVTTLLGTAVEQVDPPASLRTALLAAAAEEPGSADVSDAAPLTLDVSNATSSNSTSPNAVSSHSASSNAASPSSPSSNSTASTADPAADVVEVASPDPTLVETEPAPAVVPIRRHRAPEAGRRRWARRATAGLALAAAVAVVVAIGGLVAANRSLTEQRDAATASAAQNQQVVEIMNAASEPGTPHAVLATPQGGFAGLVVDRGRGSEVLSSGLTPADPDHTYVLWGLADGKPVGLSTIQMSDSGPLVQSVPSVEAAGRFAGFAVSLEPGHTVPATPTQVVASGQTAD